MSLIGSLAVSIIGNPDQLDKTFTNMEKRLKNTERKLGKLGKSVGKAGSSMTKMVTGPVVALGAGILGLSKKTGDYADRVLDLNAITGMSTDGIQEWQYVTERAGVGVESVTDASEQLTKQMSAMRTGTGKQAEALAELGIKFNDLEAASPDERMNILTQALMDVENPAKRAELGTDLLRGEWEKLAPVVALGSDAMEDAKQKAHDMGAVMSEDALNDANNLRIEMDELKAEFMAFGRNLASDIIPVVRDVLLPVIRDQVIPAIKSFAERIGSLIEWFGNLDPKWQKAILTAVGFAAAIGPVLIVVSKMIFMVKSIIPLIGMLSKALLFLSANPVGLIITGIAALVAGGILLYKNWDTVKTKSRELWEAIKNQIRGPVNVIIGFANSIINAYETMLNGVGKAINAIPKIKIPDWIPKFGGKSYGIPNIPHINLPKIPKLATGGNITGGGMAEVGERGREKIFLPNGAKVKPLPNFGESDHNSSNEGNDPTIHTTINIDGRKVAKATSKPQRDQLDKRNFGKGVPVT